MAETLDFTAAPLTLLVSLTKGSDFVRTIELVEGTFASGTQLKLDFGDDDVWAATISGAQAVWSVQSEVSDLVHAKAPDSVLLRYKSGTVDQVWAIGSVILYG